MAGGAPQLYDRIAVGREFIKYAKDNPDCLTVPHFSLTKGLHSGILRAWCVDDKEFRALYMEAKEQIGLNRLNCVMQTDPEKPKLPNTTYDKTSKNYNCDEKEDHRENFVFETETKSNVDKKNELLAPMIAQMAQYGFEPKAT